MSDLSHTAKGRFSSTQNPNKKDTMNPMLKSYIVLAALGVTSILFADNATKKPTTSGWGRSTQKSRTSGTTKSTQKVQTANPSETQMEDISLGSPETPRGKVASEQEARAVLSRYRVGITKYKQFVRDGKVGSWDIIVGGIQMQMTMKTSGMIISVKVKVAGREISELAFVLNELQIRSQNWDESPLVSIQMKP